MDPRVKPEDDDADMSGAKVEPLPSATYALPLIRPFGPPALRYGSGRSSLEKPNRWLFVAFDDRSSPP
ncbi:hypothetical protein [Mesorhizobium sp. YR577]|uniref:hypothetical protein n=1 Tax=Mesorhizobium sp. YR577 TaxID=1884373 RepID=UPI0008E84A4C|nr:hypothetical protein [Mesorhizobium sp. YR577]SFT63827.1 hypothetical protein SAMN05518861_10368 [Mesorhizobium sp. YR577]